MKIDLVGLLLTSVLVFSFQASAQDQGAEPLQPLRDAPASPPSAESPLPEQPSQGPTDDAIAGKTAPLLPGPAEHWRRYWVRTPRRWYFGGRISAGLGSTLTFNRARFEANGDVTETGRLFYRGDFSPAVALEAAYMGQFSWGVNFGVEANRKTMLDHPEFSSIGGQSVTQINDARLGLGLVYVNALYRWAHFYVPLGVNYSRVTLENPSVALRDVYGGLGAQLGLGYFFNEHFAVEALMRDVAVQTSEQSNTTAKINLRTGDLRDLQISAKAYF